MALEALSDLAPEALHSYYRGRITNIKVSDSQQRHSIIYLKMTLVFIVGLNRFEAQVSKSPRVDDRISTACLRLT